MKKNQILFFAVAILGLTLISADLQAQCKGWVKRKCLPSIEAEGFKFSGQMNTAVLSEGEHADIALTFNEGQTYRLMVCSQEILGDVNFKIMDTDRKVLYDSDGKEENYFDFNVESTQQFILEILVPEPKTTHGMGHHGCVSIIQGYR